MALGKIGDIISNQFVLPVTVAVALTGGCTEIDGSSDETEQTVEMIETINNISDSTESDALVILNEIPASESIELVDVGMGEETLSLFRPEICEPEGYSIGELNLVDDRYWLNRTELAEIVVRAFDLSDIPDEYLTEEIVLKDMVREGLMQASYVHHRISNDFTRREIEWTLGQMLEVSLITEEALDNALSILYIYLPDNEDMLNPGNAVIREEQAEDVFAVAVGDCTPEDIDR